MTNNSRCGTLSCSAISNQMVNAVQQLQHANIKCMLRNAVLELVVKP